MLKIFSDLLRLIFTEATKTSLVQQPLMMDTLLSFMHLKVNLLLQTVSLSVMKNLEVISRPIFGLITKPNFLLLYKDFLMILW